MLGRSAFHTRDTTVLERRDSEEQLLPKRAEPFREAGVCLPSNPPSPSSTMSTAVPPPQPRGIDLDLPTCGELQCNDRGTCTVPPGGGNALVCDCVLGYKGEFCQDTVNEAISLPLTLGVLFAIVGLVLLAFLVAKIRRRQKKKRRKEMAARHGYNVAV